MNPIQLVLKVIGNLGQLSSELKDYEQAAADLFSGKLTKAEVQQVLDDTISILSLGLVTFPGVDMTKVTNTIKGSETLVDDVIASVADVKATGVTAVVPDLAKAVADITAAVTAGVVGLTDSNKEQVLAVLAEIGKGI